MMKHQSIKGSIQVTAGGRFYGLGLFHENIAAAERVFDSIKRLKKLQNIFPR